MTGYATGTGNQLTNDGVWSYSYDAEGNLTKKSKGASAETWTYGYDNHNHMIWAKDSATDGGTVTTLATYVYDALSNRIEKDVWTQASGTTTVTRFGYDGQEIWVDLNSSNALQTRYIHGDAIDQLFARISSTGTAAWYLTDRVGSARDIVNNTGTVIDHVDYDAFGIISNESSASNGDRYKWTGREFDTETGLQFNRARFLSSSTGQWTSQDPLSFSAGDANLYRYAFNNTQNRFDPTGLLVPVYPEREIWRRQEMVMEIKKAQEAIFWAWQKAGQIWRYANEKLKQERFLSSAQADRLKLLREYARKASSYLSAMSRKSFEALEKLEEEIDMWRQMPPYFYVPPSRR